MSNKNKEITNEVFIRCKKNVKFRREDFGCVIYDRNTNSFYSCNPSGAFIIENLREGSYLQQIIKMLCEKFPDESPDKIEKDVKSFLSQLLYMGLIYYEK